MNFLPCVVDAEYRGGFRIRLTFNDLTEWTVDFRPWLEGPVFESLKNLEQFRQFFLDGGTIVWPNGADIAPETLYEAANFKRKRSKRPPRVPAKAHVQRSKARVPR